MRQATTVDAIWILGIEPELVAKARATYKQHDEIVLIIEGDRIRAEASEDGRTQVLYTLTADETMKLDYEKEVKIQLDILTPGGQSIGTPVYYRSVSECLAGEVLK